MSWPMVRLGDVGELIRGSGIRRSETVPSGMPCLRYGEIYTSFEFILDRPRSFVEQKTFDSCPHIETGDVVFSLTGENKEEIAKALAYIGKDPIAAGGDLAIWKKHGCDAKYLAYLMYSPAMLKAKADASNGHIIVHASVKKLQDIQFPLPPIDEQRRIVEKLEKELRRVDEMKAKFERMEKAAEQYFKSALAEAFDGDELRPLREYCTFEGGSQPPKSTFKDEPRQGYVRLYQIRDYNGSPRPVYIRNEDAKKCSKVGDILIGRYGASIGLVFWAADGAYNVALVRVVIINHSISSDYLFYALQSPRIQSVFRGASRNAQAGFNDSEWNKMGLPVPSLEEQKGVAERIRCAKVKSEMLVKEAHGGIETCIKMRKALLAEAFA